MGFFKPAWMAYNYNKLPKAIAAVERVSDEDELYKIAVEAPLEQVKEAAIRRIQDPAALRRLAKRLDRYKRFGGPGLAIVEGMADDKDFLEEVVNSTEEWGRDSMKFAIDKLLDELEQQDDPSVATIYGYLDRLGICYRMGSDEYYAGVRQLRRVMGHVRNHEELCTYLIEGRPTWANDEEWRAALNKMMDILTKDELQDILLAEKPHDDVRDLAWERIASSLSDEELLALVGTEDFPLRYREKACGRVGHLRGTNCVCERCGARLEHNIVDGVCAECGGVEETEVESTVWEPVVSNFKIYDENGVEVTSPMTREVTTYTYLRFPDGSRQLLSRDWDREQSWRTTR